MRFVRTSGRRKVLGILGGMGPEATVDFFREVVSQTPAMRDQDHIPIIILNYPDVPNRTKSILGGGHEALPFLIEGVAFLESVGAEFIAIPCNTAHYYLEDLRAEARIPILSLMETTRDFLLRMNPRPARAGILGTEATRQQDLYGKQLEPEGIACLYPSEREQDLLNHAIHAVKAATSSEETLHSLREVALQLMETKAADILILACTELPVLAPKVNWPLPVFNPTQALASVAVAHALDLPMEQGRV